MAAFLWKSLLLKRVKDSVPSPQFPGCKPQQQKRSRSEESLDETPPTKLQTPAPVVGSPEVPRASAAAAAPAPAAPAVCGPESAGAQACGASLPAPVASTSGESSPGTSSASSSSAATSEWRTTKGIVAAVPYWSAVISLSHA
ncbi:uncharacterized protein LOC126988850 [Eriocheir sinensis]|uniref:uncharacterized protein LOC126988850 n=1 Tax=Eriocheir sinensis TaxID=95602 RepID=UPI0021C99EA1|nr:uncharacterized protein LOC126988850 [Eriocheir sinensis]